MRTAPVEIVLRLPDRPQNACRVCKGPTSTVLDLGTVPIANHLTRDGDAPSHPLRLDFCERCCNLQLRDTLDKRGLFEHYLYETPDAPSLRAHYDKLHAYLVAHCDLDAGSFVVEAGSNTGAFLDSLISTTDRVLGVDPAKRIAAAAKVLTVGEYFTPRVAREIREWRGPAQVVVARHCMAHNAHPGPMLQAAQELLTLNGTLIIENAYAVGMIEQGDFSQVYAEHMYYWTARAMRRLLGKHGFCLVDCWPCDVQNGSMVYVARRTGQESDRLLDTLTRERIVLNTGTLDRFREHALDVSDSLGALVRDLRRSGHTVVAYGATAKATTLLNVAGLTDQDIAFCVDSTPAKHGLRLPGSRIPIVPESAAGEPDYFLLTAHNFRREIIDKVRASGNTHSRFIVAFPYVRVLDE